MEKLRKCANCSKQNSCKICSCQSVYYCDRECQIKHWKVHKENHHKTIKQNESFEKELGKFQHGKLYYSKSAKQYVISIDPNCIPKETQELLTSSIEKSKQNGHPLVKFDKKKLSSNK